MTLLALIPRFLRVRTLAVLLAAVAGPVPAAVAITINGSTFTNHSHDQFQAGDSPGSPFFTQTINSTTSQIYNIGPSNGLSGSIASPGAGTPTGSSTTTSGTVTINGNATAAGADLTPDTADDWLNGNGIPAGVSLSFQLSFTFSSANGNNLISATGNTGNGVGIDDTGIQTHGDINVGEVLNISAIAASNHQWTGTPTEAFTFTPGTVGVTRFSAFRSNSLTEASEGVTLSDGTNTWAYGNAPAGTAGTGLLLENSFGTTSILTTPAGGDVPLSFSTSAGNWNLKGFQLRTPISYDVVPAAPVTDADFDDDGDVDGSDYLVWQEFLGVGTTNQQGDANASGTVDAADLAAWQAGFVQSPASPAAASIPEPATAALAALGLLAIGLRKRS